MGILEFRNQLYLLGVEGPEKQKRQVQFDRAYKPVYEACQAARDAAANGLNLLAEHVRRIDEGEAVRFRETQYDILENIDTQLSQDVDKLIDQSIVATKGGLQDILRDLLDLDIGFLFQQDPGFAAGNSQLRSDGYADLADYLENVRKTWMSDLQDLRNRHEHQGWSLDPLDYRLAAPDKVRIILPDVDGVAVDEYLKRTANRVLLFVENMMIYSMSRQTNYPIFVKEIPPERRTPIDPKRFALAPRGLDKSPGWAISYIEGDDFIS